MRLLVLLTLTLTVAGAGVASAGVSRATTARPLTTAACSGITDSWTGLAGAPGWTNGGNWSTDAPPGANDIAVLPTDTSDNVELQSNASICKLEMDPQASLLIDLGKTLTAESVVISGGPAANSYTSLSGQISTGDLHVADGYTYVSEADASTPVNDTTSTFELDGGAHFTLTDSKVTLTATGVATLGGSGLTHFDSNSSSDADDDAKFDVDGTAQVAGALDSSGLDVITTPTSAIDAAGHTWTLGGGFSRFASGTRIQSSVSGGVLAIGDQGHLLLSGTTTVAAGATLQLQSTGLITDGRYFDSNGAGSGTLAGPGAFAWTSGAFSGHITLASNLTTHAQGTGLRQVADPNKFGTTVLTNAGGFTLGGGSVILDGSKDSFLNEGNLTVTGGTFGANSSSAPPVKNMSNGRWTFTTTAGTSIPDGSFWNAGLLTLAPAKTLTVANAFQQTASGTTKFTISSSTTASRIHATTLRLAGTAHVSSAPGYKPLKATVSGLLKGTSRTGTFSRVVSTTQRAHTSWRLRYVAARIDALLG